MNKVNVLGYSKWGINADTLASEKIKIEIVNTLCLIAIVAWTIVNTLLTVFDLESMSTWTSIPLLLSFLVPLYLNKINKISLSRISLICFASFSLAMLYFKFGVARYYEHIFVLLFILVYYLLNKLQTKLIVGSFVFLCWVVPYVFYLQNPDSQVSLRTAGIAETIFVCSMVAIYLIGKKTQDQINHISNKQKQNIELQKNNLKLITHHNEIMESKGKELRLQNEEIEMFFSMSSEFLKKPTKELIRLSESLEDTLDPQNSSMAKELFAIINLSSKRMNELIEAVFEYSAICENSARTLVDCNKVIQDIKVDIKASIVDKNVRLDIEKLPRISANNVEIRMLFQNIISNAIKYSRKSVRPHINISSTEDDVYWKFIIKDNGIGIEKAHQSNIFNMFQKLHSQDEYAGSGIGLSHCKKIVNLHGGEIWVESEPGVGTTVFFTIQKP